MASQLWRTKSIDRLLAETEQADRRLKRVLGPWTLVALGVGAVIGTGVWTLSGTAAMGQQVAVKSLLNAPLLDVVLHGSNAVGVAGRPGAGPAIALSYMLVAIACAFAAFCYAELSAMIPVAGSAYTYSYATLGEIVAWIIGWDLVLEYAVSNMAVAVGFSGYFNNILQGWGIHLPPALTQSVFSAGQRTGALFNLPAFLVVMLLTLLLVRGIRESAGTNTVMVVIKVVAILVFVVGAWKYVDPDNLRPFAPNGAQGVLTGAALVFFSYIGFDSVSTAAEECRNPQRDMPFGLLMTLLLTMVLYVSVAVVLTGIVDYRTLDPNAPVASALNQLGLKGMSRWVSIGAVCGMLSSILVYQLGQARIWFAMSRDRLLPGVFSAVHPRYRTPHVSTWVAGIVVAVPAGLWDIGELAELSNIGTLFAFALVCAGVWALRRRRPELRRPFRVPALPVVSVLGILSCVILMTSLPLVTWLRFVVWLVVGLVIYFSYSRRRSELYQR